MGTAVSTTTGTTTGACAEARGADAAISPRTAMPETRLQILIRYRPSQCAVTSESERPGASWSGATLVFSRLLRPTTLDPPECAAIPGSDDLAWSAWQQPQLPHPASPVR